MSGRVKKRDNTSKILDALQAIGKREVLIGVPSGSPPREEDDITNAELAYIHSKGSPMHGIPARPFLEPSIEANKATISKLLAKALKAGAEGGSVDAGLELVGQFASDAARRWFVDPQNGWPPNSPITIKRKGSDRPLIDTGELRKSITFVVR